MCRWPVLGSDNPNWSDWAWSRDGQRLVWVDLQAREQRLRVVQAQVRSLQQLETSNPLEADIMADSKKMSVALFNHGEHVALVASYVTRHGFFPKFLVAVYSIQGQRLLQVKGTPPTSYDVSDMADLYCMPVWHPELATIAWFSNGLLHVHDLVLSQTRQVTSLRDPALTSYVDEAEAETCPLVCWSPCGSLLCFQMCTASDYQTQTPYTVAVVRADGGGLWQPSS